MGSITLKMQHPALYSEAGDVVRLFYGDTPLTLYREGDPEPEAGLVIVQRARREGAGYLHEALLKDPDGVALTSTYRQQEMGEGTLEQKRYFKYGVKIALYHLLTQATGKVMPWGSLTGIRPTKLAYELLSQGMTPQQAAQYLRDTFDVSRDKADLLFQILKAQQGIVCHESFRQLDVYVGIPFCPSRCTYCSFAACDIRKNRKWVEPYLAALHHEIKVCGQMAQQAGWQVRAVYLGGGTPTAISAPQLSALLEAVNLAFPGAAEVTVEAGRPDSIDRDKLRALREAGVGRVSINPQTMNGETLMRMGRTHTPEQIVQAFALAREAGFEAINMDLIAGLPGESAQDMARTLRQIADLAPDNLTVHTLAMKRASKLKEEKGRFSLPSGEEVLKMLEEARTAAAEWGMEPYYLYRQKYMTGNFENIGYSLPGKACIYNIDIMEETHSILALGAGGISKWVYPAENRLERTPNVKNIEQYIARVDEMIARKEPRLCGALLDRPETVIV